jgi:hypothetical protein
MRLIVTPSTVADNEHKTKGKRQRHQLTKERSGL